MAKRENRRRRRNAACGRGTYFGREEFGPQLIAAALLGQGESAIHNVPLISDIVVMSKVIETLGGTVRRDGHTLHVDTAGVDTWETPYELVSKMRASISVLGPLVARFGKARVAMPGGCNLGARKIDMHMVGMEALGVHFHTDHGYIEASTPNGLHGAYVALDFPSVGATENTMMCAVTAKGQTVIENAAREPEIEDLANMLNSMGARISGAGTAEIIIDGVELSSLHPCEHSTVETALKRAPSSWAVRYGRPRYRSWHRSELLAHGIDEAVRHGLLGRCGR